jgi:hypothetical protein
MDIIQTLDDHPAASTLKFCRSMAAKYQEMLLTGDADDSLQPLPRTNPGKPIENRRERMAPCREAFERGDCAVDIAAEHGVHPQTLIRYAWTHGWDSPLFEKYSRALTMAKTKKAVKYIAAGAKPALAAKQMGISYASLLDARLRIAALKANPNHVPQQPGILCLTRT